MVLFANLTDSYKWCRFLDSAIQNPEVVALRGGLSTILKNVIDCQLSRINEALITTVLHLLNHPKTRQYMRTDVELEVGSFIFATMPTFTRFGSWRSLSSHGPCVNHASELVFSGPMAPPLLDSFIWLLAISP